MMEGADFSWVKNAAIRAEVNAEYRRIRDVMITREAATLNCDLNPKADFYAGARKIGIEVGRSDGRDCVMFDFEDEAVILQDYLSMFYASDGTLPRREFVRKHLHDDNATVRTMCEFWSDYRYTWLRPLQTKTGFGLRCLDLLSGREFFLVDHWFSKTAAQGAARLIFTGVHSFGRPELGCVMTGGAGLPFPDCKAEELLAVLLDELKIAKRPPLELTDAEWSEFVASSVRSALHVMSESGGGIAYS